MTLLEIMTSNEKDLENFIWHYSRSQLQILGFIQMLVPSTSEAEDILQETSIVLMNKWPEFDLDRNFTNWACGIARYETFKHLRKQKKHVGLSLDLLQELSDMALAAKEHQDDQKRQDALAQCFESLSPPLKQLVQERYRLNKSVAELAKIRDKTERSIYKSLTNIRNILQACIQRRINEVAV